MLNKLSVGAGLFAASVLLSTVAGAEEIPVPERPGLRMQIDSCMLTPDTMVALRNMLRQNPTFRSIYCTTENPAQLTVAFAPSQDNRTQKVLTDTKVVTDMAGIILTRETNLREVRMLFRLGMPDDGGIIAVGVR